MQKGSKNDNTTNKNINKTVAEVPCSPSTPGLYPITPLRVDRLPVLTTGFILDSSDSEKDGVNQKTSFLIKFWYSFTLFRIGKLHYLRFTGRCQLPNAFQFRLGDNRWRWNLRIKKNTSSIPRAINFLLNYFPHSFAEPNIWIANFISAKIVVK